MGRSMGSVVALALAAFAPGLSGCAQIAGVEDREVIPVLTIASGQSQPYAIAVDEDAVYWTNQRSDGGQGASTGGSLRRQIKDDPVVTDLLAPSLESFHAIALDATHIYFSSTDTDPDPELTCPDDDDAQRDKLWRLSKEGPFPAASGQLLWGSCGRVESIALDAANAYSTRPTAERITWVPKDGSSKRKDLTEGGEPFGVAVDGTNVFWTDPARREIGFDDTGDDAPGKALLSNLDAAPRQIVVDEVNLYWLTERSVLRFPRAPSAGEVPMALLDDGLVAAAGIAAHGNNLYVTDAEGGIVYEIRKDGSVPPVQIAKGQAAPTGIAADDTGVYWTNLRSGEIVRYTDE